MRRVGASTSRRGSGRGSAGSVIVSPIVISGRPARATISPALASPRSTRSTPRAVCRRRDRARQGDDAAGLDGAGGVLRLLAHDDHALADAHRPVPDAADRHAADVVVRGQRGDEQLERVAGLMDGRRGDLDEEVEQRPQVGARDGEVPRRGARLRVRVDDRELDLVIVGAEVDEQLVDRVEDLGRAGVAAVDLVERDDDRQPPLHRLGEDIARLWQRPLGSVDEQQDRVHHEQAALHLAAEVGVAGGVDDVEPRAVVVDRRLLGEDRDPLLALEVAGVEDAVDDRLVGAEGAGLAEEAVDEGRLAMVDVGDDRDVAQVVAHGEGRRSGGRHGVHRYGSEAARATASAVGRGRGYTVP